MSKIIENIKLKTTFFGRISLAGGLISVPLLVIACILNHFLEHPLWIVPVGTFGLLLFLSAVLFFEDVVTKNDNINNLNALLLKLKRNNYLCPIEKLPNDYEFFDVINDTFVFACNEKCYAAGQYGCFEVDYPVKELRYSMIESDKFYYEVLTEKFNEISENREKPVKIIEKDIFLVKIQNQYVLQKNNIVLEIRDEDAQDIIEGNITANTVFSKYIRNYFGITE